MDILEEIRIWGARFNDSDYWGAGAYTKFADHLEDDSVYLDSGKAVLVEYERPNDEEEDQELQLVFSVQDRTYAIDGSYSSWNGTSWFGLPYEVEAQPVQKISYVRKR